MHHVQSGNRQSTGFTSSHPFRCCLSPEMGFSLKDVILISPNCTDSELSDYLRRLSLTPPIGIIVTQRSGIRVAQELGYEIVYMFQLDTPEAVAQAQKITEMSDMPVVVVGSESKEHRC